jgi:hypothetical protein
MRMKVAPKLGRLAWCLVIVAVGAACTAAEDEGSSPTISQRPRAAGPPAERTDLQLRSVIAIVRPSSPEWSDTRPTCPGHGDDVAACIASTPDEEIVILGPGKGSPKYVLGAVIVDEQDVQRAEAHQDDQADFGWSVSVSLTDDAASALRVATEAAVDSLAPQNQIAIIVDSRIVSSPTVVVPITSGSLVLTGRFTEAEATSLAAGLTGSG